MILFSCLAGHAVYDDEDDALIVVILHCILHHIEEDQLVFIPVQFNLLIEGRSFANENADLLSLNLREERLYYVLNFRLRIDNRFWPDSKFILSNFHF